MTIELSRDQEVLIQKQLASGRYHSRAEVIAEALELLGDQAQLEESKLARLRTEVRKGLESSDPEPLDMASIIAEAEVRFKQRTER